MLARLGEVLYWIGAGFGILLIGLALAGYVFGNGDFDSHFFLALIAVFGALIWLSGRALRYILAGY